MSKVNKQAEQTQVTEQKAAIVATTDAALGLIQLAFKNGKTLSIETAKLSPEIATQALLHGLKQKLVDAAAISRDLETGRSATVDDKYEAVRVVVERLLAGQWNAGRGEGSGSSGGLLYRALLAVYPDRTPEQIKNFLEKKSDAEKTALRANPKIAAAIEQIRAESGKKANIDTEELLKGLE